MGSHSEDPLENDERLLESYTKIWESFSSSEKGEYSLRAGNQHSSLFYHQKVMSKSPILSHSTPFCKL